MESEELITVVFRDTYTNSLGETFSAGEFARISFAEAKKLKASKLVIILKESKAENTSLDLKHYTIEKR